MEALNQIIALDKSFLKTENYLGLTYFWHYDYRHYLRDASPSKRRKIHAAFLKARLAIDGESKAHFSIIQKYIK